MPFGCCCLGAGADYARIGAAGSNDTRKITPRRDMGRLLRTPMETVSRTSSTRAHDVDGCVWPADALFILFVYLYTFVFCMMGCVLGAQMSVDWSFVYVAATAVIIVVSVYHCHEAVSAASSVACCSRICMRDRYHIISVSAPTLTTWFCGVCWRLYPILSGCPGCHCVNVREHFIDLECHSYRD